MGDEEFNLREYIDDKLKKNYTDKQIAQCLEHDHNIKRWYNADGPEH